MCCGDAVDEDKLILCCALCCLNCACYPACDSLGCSGKMGFCCLNAECCCKPGAPCLMPCCCLGCRCVNNECALVNGQCQAAIPCNDEVPVALVLAGVSCYPKVGCCMRQKALTMSR